MSFPIQDILQRDKSYSKYAHTFFYLSETLGRRSPDGCLKSIKIKAMFSQNPKVVIVASKLSEEAMIFLEIVKIKQELSQ
jgi:hypothetical protein